MIFNKNVLQFLSVSLLMTIWLSGNASAETHSFSLAPNTSEAFDFTVTNVGVISLQTTWTPEVLLDLVLYRPGQEPVPYHFQSPNTLNYSVTDTDLNKGNRWNISIKNNNFYDSINGSITITVPIPIPIYTPNLTSALTPISTLTATPTASPAPTPTLTPASTSTPAPSPTPTVTPTPFPLIVTITSEPMSIEIGETSTVTVIVTGNGKEISGADIMLSSIPAGKVNPTKGRTDPFGQFISNLTASDSGKVTVRALVKKEGFIDSKEEIQILANSRPFRTTTPELALITGKVVDAKTGNPVQGAIVAVDGKSFSTGLDGTYELRVNTGEFSNLTVIKQGYESITKPAKVSEEGTVVDFLITPALAPSSWSWSAIILILLLISAGLILILYGRRKKEGKEETMEKKKSCIHCRAPIPFDAQLCPVCGKKQEDKQRFCMYCQAQMPFSSEHCPKCGKMPLSGVDVKTCLICGEVIPITANFCGACGAGQPE